MTEIVFEVHRWLGYLVAVVVLVAAVMAFARAKDGRGYDGTLYRVAMGLLTLQLLIGLALYGIDGYWDGRPEIAYVHPILALLAVGVGHGLVGRAGKQAAPAEAHRSAGIGLALALLFVLLAIGVASAPAFL